MRSELGDEWPVIDTTFDPIQQVLRHAGFSAIQLILDNFASAKPMIEAVTETVINYVRELKINGVDGVFYSTRAAATEACSYGFTQEAFEELRPVILRRVEHAAAFLIVEAAVEAIADVSLVAGDDVILGLADLLAAKLDAAVALAVEAELQLQDIVGVGLLAHQEGVAAKALGGGRADDGAVLHRPEVGLALPAVEGLAIEEADLGRPSRNAE